MNINHLKRIAGKSDHKRYQHATLILAGSRVIVCGFNTTTHHSEIMAIRRLNAIYRNNNSRRPRNLRMINLMIKKKTGNIGNSCPCSKCFTATVAAGIRKVEVIWI